VRHLSRGQRGLAGAQRDLVVAVMDVQRRHVTARCGELAEVVDAAGLSTDSKLTPFAYVILALVGRDGAGPRDIVRRR
jgi:hypothetical protein